MAWQKVWSTSWLGRSFAVGALLAGLMALAAPASAQIFDPDFSATTNGAVYATAVQADGKLLLGGFFTQVNAVAHKSLARLNADGSLDTTFTASVTSGSNVYALAIQPDGRILVGGDFLQLSGTTKTRIARLMPDGSLDSTFTASVSSTSSCCVGSVNALLVQPDGKILVGGAYNTVNGLTRNNLARLNADGTLDGAFAPSVTGAVAGDVYALALQPNGAIVMGGVFTAVNGIAKRQVARLNASGTLDNSFGSPMIGNSEQFVDAVAVKTDGHILVGGVFTTASGGTFAQLNADGSVDPSFNVPVLLGPGFHPPTYVAAIALQPDGRILLGGHFGLVDGINSFAATRLSADGTFDPSFGATGGASDSNVISAIAVQSDGKVLVGGTLGLSNVARLLSTPCAIVLSATTFPLGLINVAYPATTITQTGGVGTTTFAVTGGALPPGMSLSSGGTVSGTPTMTGTFSFTVTATDTTCHVSRSYSVTIGGNTPPTISSLPNRVTAKNTPITVAVTIGDNESVPSALTLSGSSSNPVVVPSANIVFGGTGAVRSATITPAPNQQGTTTITITVSDGLLTASTAFVLRVGRSAGDLNADGRSDVVWRNKNTGQNIGWLMNGLTVSTSAFLPTIADTNWEVEGVGDFDGDGHADLIWRNKSTGQNLAWLMNGTTVTLSAFLPTIADTNWDIKGVGDLDGDGKADVILRNQATGQDIGWLMNGLTVTTSAFLPTIADTHWVIAGVGDLDGDGKADVLLRNTMTGQDIGWLMNGLTVSTSALLPTIADTNWAIKGVGDLDGDGKADVILRNTTTGQDIGWLMTGLTVANAAFLPTIADTNWAIKSVGDFDGDGKADVLLRNGSTGQDIVWLMNGLVIQNAAFIVTIADTNWEVVGP